METVNLNGNLCTSNFFFSPGLVTHWPLLETSIPDVGVDVMADQFGCGQRQKKIVGAWGTLRSDFCGAGKCKLDASSRKSLVWRLLGCVGEKGLGYKAISKITVQTPRLLHPSTTLLFSEYMRYSCPSLTNLTVYLVNIIVTILPILQVMWTVWSLWLFKWWTVSPSLHSSLCKQRQCSDVIRSHCDHTSKGKVNSLCVFSLKSGSKFQDSPYLLSFIIYFSTGCPVLSLPQSNHLHWILFSTKLSLPSWVFQLILSVNDNHPFQGLLILTWRSVLTDLGRGSPTSPGVRAPRWS